VRNERKYKIITLMTTMLMFLLLGNCAREFFRLEHATVTQRQEYVLKGARTYAQNCMQCHGPRGEGSIGMALNRELFQVDYSSVAGKEHYNMIFNTLKLGRKGNDAHFQWVETPGGWLSYSTMPAWHMDSGGPLDDDYLHALTLFIMDPSGEQWNLVGDSDIAPVPKANLEKDETGQIPLPDAAVSAATNASAKALLNDIPKSLCLTCHVIGSRGAYIGPDLSKTGSWGFDQAFLEEWIKYANVPGPNDADQTPAMPHDRRMPVFWASNRAYQSPDLDLGTPTISEGPYYMPRFAGRLTNEEISLISEYLMGLK